MWIDPMAFYSEIFAKSHTTRNQDVAIGAFRFIREVEPQVSRGHREDLIQAVSVIDNI
jgi:hypothetical protein